MIEGYVEPKSTWKTLWCYFIAYDQEICDLNIHDPCMGLVDHACTESYVLVQVSCLQLHAN